VAKTFRSGTAALAGLELSVEPGEFVSLLGPSGCGKSTALRILAGLAGPDAGARHLDPALAERGRIGFVVQEATLMPWATAEENVFLPLRLGGVSRAEARGRVASALEAVGLAGFERAFPRELSGGMRMRVSLARAYVTRPRLILLDEPFAALDEITRFRLNEDLLLLQAEQGWTVVFVTHSVFEAVFLSTRVLVMTRRPGRIAAEIPIRFAAPRDEALRTSGEYAETCRLVSARLAEATR
jgi:NitT/TauT family transport system ATP-binding protein